MKYRFPVAKYWGALNSQNHAGVLILTGCYLFALIAAPYAQASVFPSFQLPARSHHLFKSNPTIELFVQNLKKLKSNSGSTDAQSLGSLIDLLERRLQLTGPVRNLQGWKVEAEFSREERRRYFTLQYKKFNPIKFSSISGAIERPCGRPWRSALRMEPGSVKQTDILLSLLGQSLVQATGEELALVKIQEKLILCPDQDAPGALGLWQNFNATKNFSLLSIAALETGAVLFLTAGLLGVILLASHFVSILSLAKLFLLSAVGITFFWFFTLWLLHYVYGVAQIDRRVITQDFKLSLLSALTALTGLSAFHIALCAVIFSPWIWAGLPLALLIHPLLNGLAQRQSSSQRLNVRYVPPELGLRVYGSPHQSAGEDSAEDAQEPSAKLISPDQVARDFPFLLSKTSRDWIFNHWPSLLKTSERLGSSLSQF